MIYTTNAIENLNSTYKKLNRQRTVYPSDKALIKALYLSTMEATKKWSQPLKNRGIKDIIMRWWINRNKRSYATAFPQTEYQHCVVYQVRNILKYVSYKDKKEFTSDLKSIYLAATEIQAMENLDKVTEKCEEKYPNSMSS